jgi:hypothetical protein
MTLITSSTQGTAYTERATDLLNARKVSQQNRDTFLEVLKKTSSTLTPTNAKDLLKSLSAEETEAVRAVQGLADPFDIQGLNEEGAYNLLCQPGSYKDLDNNGFTSVGAAMMYSFPPANAPDEVKAAYEEAMAGKGADGKRLMPLCFAVFEISANVKYDANHNPVGVYSPGEPGYTNIYAQPGFSYRKLVNDLQEYLDNMRAHMSEEQYQSQKSFADDFEAALIRNGAK